MTMNSSRALVARRLSLLARSHWRANTRRYGGWLLVVGILLLAALLFFLSIGMLSDNPVRFTFEEQSSLYFFGLLVFGPVFAAQHFGPMNQPHHAMMVLMQPASDLEKWLVALITVVILFPLVYAVVFVMLVGPAAALGEWWDFTYLPANSPPERLDLPDAQERENYGTFIPFVGPFWFTHLSLGLIYCALTGLAVSGSILFKRAPLVSTLVLGFLITLGTFMLAAIFGEMGPIDANTTLSLWWADSKAPEVGMVAHGINAAFWLGIPALLWLAAWRCLKDRELK
jgi:uncharacterized membrane protein